MAPKPSKKPDNYTPRLKSDYEERIVPAMIERFGYKNRLEVPRLDKIVINMGVGDATRTRSGSRPRPPKCRRLPARSR